MQKIILDSYTFSSSTLRNSKLYPGLSLPLAVHHSIVYAQSGEIRERSLHNIEL